MRGFARDLGMAPAKGLDGMGALAQGGQPGDCAAEVAVARFQANRFGQELGSCAVGVFSSRPARRSGRCTESESSAQRTRFA